MTDCTQELTAPVVEATLMEDRAHVIRRGRQPLPSGTTSLWIRSASPAIVEKTLAVSVRGGQASVINTVVTRRHIHLDTDKPEQLRVIDDALVNLKRDEARLGAELERTRSDGILVREAQGLTVKELVEDCAWNTGLEGKEEDIHRFTETEMTLIEQAVALEEQISDLAKKRRDLEARRRAAQDAGSNEVSDIEVKLSADAPNEIELQIEYVVPGACWRPQHTAQLVEDKIEGNQVLFATDACVWQNTGESWDGVTLLFSTERPSLGKEPPLLSEDLLAAHKTDATIHVEAREQEIYSSGLGASPKASSELPGIDDGGDPLCLKAPSPATVPSDGRPYRVRLSAFKSEASTELRLVPERSAAVFWRSEQANNGTGPILAGPVDLIRKNGLVGRTSVLFVASGERFELGWGPELSLRVHRDLRTFAEETKMLSQWSKKHHHITTRISNIGATPLSMNVLECVPVSEVEKVRVELEPRKTTGQTKPDKDGFVRWTLTLKPYSQEELTLGYTIKQHSDVVGL